MGVWNPSLHFLVPPAVSSCMFQTMLLCIRLGVDKNIAALIVEFVCTAGDCWIGIGSCDNFESNRSSNIYCFE